MFEKNSIYSYSEDPGFDTASPQVVQRHAHGTGNSELLSDWQCVQGHAPLRPYSTVFSSFIL